MNTYYKLFIYFNVCLSVMLDSLSCSFTSYPFLLQAVHLLECMSKCYYLYYTQTQIKVKEQLIVRKDMHVNEHERLSNITLRHKLK
jgi:hypothetical protein